MKALVVVEDDALLKEIADFFGRRQLGVSTFREGAEAARAVERQHFRFVIVDLSVLGSQDVCRSVRWRSDGEHSYVLAVLPEASTRALREALEIGADDYLTPPLTLSALQLRMAIAERSLARRLRLEKGGRGQGTGERRYRTLVQTMSEGVFEVDAAGRIESANAQMSSFTGYTVDELVGESADELLVADEFRTRLPGQTLLGSGVGSEEYTLPLRRKDGGQTWVKLVGAPVTGSDGRSASLGIVQDLTEQRKAEEGLRHREEYFRALLENSSDLISIIDRDGRVIYQSPSSERVLGVPPEVVVGSEILDFVHGDDHPTFQDAFRRALDAASSEQRQAPSAVVRMRRSGGEWLYVESVCVNLTDDPVIGGVVVTSRDISERRRVEAALKRERAFFQQLFNNSPSSIVILDTSTRVVDVNSSFVDLFQFTVSELAGKLLGDLIVPEELREEAQDLAATVESGQSIEHETVRRRKDGVDVDVSIICYPIEVAGRRIGAYAIFDDITERKKAERQLFHEAFHDSLTGLPNRSLLEERLERSLRRANRRDDYQFALVFIDLDRFKIINDNLGHAAGDELLIEMARRLETCLRPGDTVARLGGDEFNIILEDIKEISDATRVAERILESMAEPFQIANQEVTSSGSIGIAFSSSGYRSAEDLMRDADIAMYRAKSAGKARYEIFDSEMHRSAVKRVQLGNELRQAFENEALEHHYQPIYSLSRGHVVGFEALARWRHHERGLLPARAWLPALEEAGLAGPFTRWSLRAACARLAAWQSAFPEHDAAQISLNLSPSELSHPDLLEQLDAELGAAGEAGGGGGIHAGTLTLELSEQVLDPMDDALLDLLWRLRDRGFRLCIDDFGTASSSLSRLQRLPIHSVKIDRSFIGQMEPGQEAVEIVRAVAAVGQSLGWTVIAEGVESDQQIDTLRDLGVLLAQGYLLAQPLTAEEATERMDDRLPLPSIEDG
ncbi:MAG: EAL domain-containing protein [Acidobacteriota bacterium]